MLLQSSYDMVFRVTTGPIAQLSFLCLNVYTKYMKKEGPVHSIPKDLQLSLDTRPEAYEAWKNCTPLAQNEWICWIETAKLIETRQHRIDRTINELIEGKRRPCCWPGCAHRERDTK